MHLIDWGKNNASTARINPLDLGVDLYRSRSTHLGCSLGNLVDKSNQQKYKLLQTKPCNLYLPHPSLTEHAH